MDNMITQSSVDQHKQAQNCTRCKNDIRYLLMTKAKN